MKILFIGNSYTFYNDMPKLFENICKERGIDITADHVTIGGYRLSQHLDISTEHGAKLREKLENEPYDYIVLQEFSTLPATAPEAFFKSVGEFAAIIQKNGARPVLYETWGRADRSETLTERGWTHEEMQDKLRCAYESAAKEHNMITVYAGERFHEAYRNGEQVFTPDGSHPSPLGSKIIACEFYRTLFGSN